MLALFALLLAAASLATSAALATRVRRLEATSHKPSSLGEGGVGTLPTSSPLHGLSIALDVSQDHPHPVFATLLRDLLLREGALLEDAADVTISGTVVCNGYADVYFRADLTARTKTETLLALAERPPHGDRPGNLALELVARLKAEWAKRERHGALRELHEP